MDDITSIKILLTLLLAANVGSLLLWWMMFHHVVLGGPVYVEQPVVKPSYPWASCPHGEPWDDCPECNH